MIPSLGTTVVKGMANLTTHSKYLSVVEAVAGYSEHIAMARSYGVLKPGEGKIDVCLMNHSARQVILLMQTTVGEIMPADMVPSSVGPQANGTQEVRKKPLQRKGKMKVKKNN